MKKHLKLFINQPRKVILVFLAIAIIFGFLGYKKINKIPTYEFTQNDVSSKNVFLSFPFGGRVNRVSVKIGDKVKKGDILATLVADDTDGSFIQAQAAYELAKANYQKVINGATGPTIDVAKAVVNTAKINLEQINDQQNTLVENAHRNLLNSTPEAIPYDGTADYIPPTLSGNYSLEKEGTIKVSFYYSVGGISFNVSGLSEGSGSCNTITAQPLGDSGLYLKCPFKTINISDWNIEIPNKKAVNFPVNDNAYQLALSTKDQAIAVAQATLDQANASLTALVSSARPEDVAVAQAQVDNAYGILISNPEYKNTTISAPADGTITTVHISQGQTIEPNAPAIEIIMN